jgi:hypothetical protein
MYVLIVLCTSLPLMTNICHVRFINRLECFGSGLVDNCTELVFDQHKSKSSKQFANGVR